MERIPVLQMRTLLMIAIQVDMHDKLALQLQDDVTERISEWDRPGCSLTRNRRLIHWKDAGEHRGHVASSGGRYGGSWHATGSCHHAG